MIYFYAGLGAAMLTGIMALFEVGMALRGQSLLDDRSGLDTYQDVVNSADQLFLRMLTESSDLKALGSGRYQYDLCQQILCRIHGMGCLNGNRKALLYAELQSYDIASSTPSTGIWSSSCALERDLGKGETTHRLLVLPNRERIDFGYELYTCILEANSLDQRCLFERGA